MSDKQRTICREITLKGTGLHTGIESCITFKPAPVNHGYKFCRIDIQGAPVVDAVIENVIDTSRGTAIESNGVRIGTVEHVLSSVYGLGIDNIMIEVNAPEVPIMDGSARYFVEVLLEAGITEQNADKDYYIIKKNITYTDDTRGVEITAIPYDGYAVNVLIDYNSPIIVNQFCTLTSLDNYSDEIAKCRTFVFLHELERLLNNNQIKGGDLNNAIIIIDREVTQEELNRLADLFGKPRVEVKPQGILNNLELYFNNEPARHKLLDIVGDLALLGMPVRGKFLAIRPGHTPNIEFARKLKQIIKKERSKTFAPEYDPNFKPALDINDIKRLLPHRPPFLFVDKIVELTDTSIIGLKNVTMNEGFFVGHFPEEPVMPGVLQVEAMAQVGGILVLNSVPDPENYSTYLLKIENVKYKKKVIPGDTIIFSLEFVTPMRRGIANMRGLAFVGDTVVIEGEMMAQIVRNKG
ncbi:MAG: bifunctional UDP-3-O-[3-hydroxymyristoyl] N-acetylglucosamine deacetylase/3-hydroxyacyl-ACP dehydratase [Bacteroidetes bacterium]|nr:bifunctional UDP-3-O-[3-hydroxymyristoyl] N-acetylglucosamine deacetylase/3-hydroxyacyl-ACP dehydratase [Bacteroidota bacterium]